MLIKPVEYKRKVFNNNMSVGELNSILNREKKLVEDNKARLSEYEQSVEDVEKRIKLLKSKSNYTAPKNPKILPLERLKESDFIKVEILKLFRINENIVNFSFSKVDELFKEILNKNNHIRLVIYLNRRCDGLSKNKISKELDISSSRLYQIINSLSKALGHPKKRSEFIKILEEMN